MKVTIFGAVTTTGRALVDAALAAGHDTTILAQEPGTFPIAHDRLRILEGDVFDIPTVEAATRGADAVCTAFDEPLDQLPGTDVGDAMENVLAALARYQTSRIVVVAPLGDAPVRATGLRARLANLFGDDDSTEGDDEQEALVRASTAEWTIVHPVGPTDGAATGDVRAGTDVDADGADPVSRTDLAAFVVDLLDSDAYVREVVTVAG